MKNNMEGLEKELRAEAYNNLRSKYSKGNLSHTKFTKKEIYRLFKDEFKNKPEIPRDSNFSNSHISNAELLRFVRKITINKQMDKEAKSVQKEFYQKVKQLEKSL